MWTDGINTFSKHYVLGHCTELVQSFSVQDTHLGYQWRSNSFHPLNPGWNAAHSCLAGSAAEEADRAGGAGALTALDPCIAGLAFSTADPGMTPGPFPNPGGGLWAHWDAAPFLSKETHPTKKFALWRKLWPIYSHFIQDYHKSFLQFHQPFSMSASQIKC